MATDIEARESSSSAMALGIIALILVAVVVGFLFLRPGPTTEVLPVAVPGTSSSTIVNNPAPAAAPDVNVNVSPPAASSGGSTSSTTTTTEKTTTAK